MPNLTASISLYLYSQSGTWPELMEERDRVLHWSSEVLARVNDNIKSEDTFLMDYEEDKINEKINKWIDQQNPRIEQTREKYPNRQDDCEQQLQVKITKIKEKRKKKLLRDYKSAYCDLKKFNKRIDSLGKEQMKLHNEIVEMEKVWQKERQKNSNKFGALRAQVFHNLRASEKMLFEEKRLKVEFSKKIYDVDHKHMTEIGQEYDKIVKEFEKCASK
ncbi:uncharacterized protein [Prorops nasuta]|uniref:uncharacterized protein n=1 Tax=Prorops nasuta TaxID=863751 RepID=UPI0034CF282B